MAGIRAMFLLAAASVTATASAARLDTSYGPSASGLVVTAVEGQGADALAALLQADGKIVVVGATPIVNPNISTANSDFFVMRFNVDGTLDQSFSGDGVATLDFAGGADSATAVVQQADGKLVVGGQIKTAQGFGVALLRFNVDGSLDPGFGTEGRTVFSEPAADVRFTLHSLAIQSTGRLVCLYGAEASQHGLTLGRLLANGQVDTSFATDADAARNYASVQVTADDKLLVSTHAYNLNWNVHRLLPNGGLDTTFGNGGEVHVPDMVSLEFIGYGVPSVMLPQADGGLLLGGVRMSMVNGPPSTLQPDARLAKVTSTGALDPGFATAGVSTAFGNPPVETYISNGVSEPGGGSLILSGRARSASRSSSLDSTLIRLRPNGQLDTTFAANGRLKINLDEGSTEHSFWPVAMLRSPRGELFIVGARGVQMPADESGGFVLRRGVVESTSRIAVVKVIATPEFSFAQSTASVNESQGAAQLSVTRNGVTQGPVSVVVTARSGTADSADFSSTPQTLTWQAGEADTKTVSIAVTNDSADEPDETFTVQLSQPSEGTIVSSNATVTLVDDDPPPSGGDNGGGKGGGGGGAISALLLALLAGMRFHTGRFRRSRPICVA